MAITQDDFKKVWASTSSVPKYTFSDTDYKNGWEFVGNLPPTRAMWDELQRKNDEKMQFLQENGSMCFDSVTDMKSSNLDAGQTTFTKGYYSINDGGAGVYSIRGKVAGETEDGGSVIFLENENVAELITDGTVNVKQFGAKGDGVTDDSAVFAKVMAYANKNWDGNPHSYVRPIVYAPIGKYLITDTFRIEYPCDVLFDGDIIYDGTRDKPAVYIGGTVGNNLMSNMTIRFRNVLDYNFRNAPLFATVVDFSSTNYVGIKTQNMQYVNLMFDTIAGFTIGFLALATTMTDGTGWFSNVVTGKNIFNCLNCFKIVNDAGGWANVNTVNDIYFRHNTNIWNAYACICINTEHSNDSTFLIVGWTWNNISFEGNVTKPYTCIYLNGVIDWKINYYAEVSGTAWTNFCVIDCSRSNIDRMDVCTNIIFNRKGNSAIGKSYESINVINQHTSTFPLNPISNELKYIYKRNSGAYLLCNYNKDDLLNDCLQISTTGVLLKIFRGTETWKNTSLPAMLQRSLSLYEFNVEKGLSTTSSYAFILTCPNVNTTFRILFPGRILIKLYDTDGNVIQRTAETERIDLIGNLFWASNTNSYNLNTTVHDVSFTILNSDVKYVLVLWNCRNATEHLDRFTVYSNDGNCAILNNLDGDERYMASNVPSIIDTRVGVGARVYKSDSTTNEYWEIEKQTDNTLAWIAH